MNKLIRTALALFFCCATMHAMAQAVAQAAIGRILVASGAVELIRDGRGAPATVGGSLAVGDRVRTGADGNVQLWFADSSVVALRHASEFHVEQFRFDNKSETDNLLFNLVKGGLRTMAGLIGNTNPMAYRVRTPNATLGRRGTQYTLVHCQDDCANAGEGTVVNGTYGGVYEGRVIVNNNAGAVEFAAGEFFYVADVNSIPKALLGPPSFLADRLRGLGKGVAKAAPETASNANTSTSASSDAPPGSGSPSVASGSGSSGATDNGSSGTTSAGTPTAAATSAGNTSSSASANTNVTNVTSVSLPTTNPLASSSPTSTSNIASVTATVPVAPFTSTSTVGSGGAPTVVPSAVAATPTLGLAMAWFVTPPINYVEDPWGRTMFAAPAILHTSGSGASERLNDFSIFLPDALNVAAQQTPSETMHGDVATGTTDMVGYDGAANIHWGRWVSGTLYKTNKPPGVETPLTGIHYIYGNPTPDTVIAAMSGNVNYNDIGGTIAVDSTGARATGGAGFGSINVNFTSRTGTISAVNYVFPTATYSYTNLPFQVFVQAGVGAWLGGDVSGGGTCTGSGCTTPGPGGAGAVFNGIFFGKTGSYIGLSFHGSSGGHTSGFGVVRLFH